MHGPVLCKNSYCSCKGLLFPRSKSHGGMGLCTLARMKTRRVASAAPLITKIQKLFSEGLARENDFLRQENRIPYGQKTHPHSMSSWNAANCVISRSSPRGSIPALETYAGLYHRLGQREPPTEDRIPAGHVPLPCFPVNCRLDVRPALSAGLVSASHPIKRRPRGICQSLRAPSPPQVIRAASTRDEFFDPTGSRRSGSSRGDPRDPQDADDASRCESSLPEG